MSHVLSSRRGISRRSSVLSHAIEPLEGRRLLAAIANKVADINQTTSFLSPEQFTPVGNVTYFAGKSYHGDGLELWVTDGTTAGTRRVKDINPGKASSNPSNLFAVGSTLYFSADDGVHGSELWKSDGTEAGTIMVKDLRTGSASSSPGSTGASTSATGGVPAMVNNNGVLYFVATDDSGMSLFKSDGTSNGTVRVTTSNFSFAARGTLAALNGEVYFGAVLANGSTGNAGLFRTNSLIGAAPVISVKTFTTTTKPSNLTVFNGKLYFSADQDSINKGDLFVSDSTSGGTKLVAAIGSSSNSSPVNFTVSGGLLYFVNYETSTGKTDLWRTDGSTGGTSALTSNVTIDRNFNRFVPVGTNGVLFPASGPTGGSQVYRSDGTIATTTVSTLPGATANSILGANGRYYVLATKTDQYGALYVTTGSGTPTLVADMGTQFFWGAGLLNSAGSSTPDLLFSRTFTAGLGDLWRSDGTTANTLRVGTSNALGTASSMLDYYNSTGANNAFTKFGSGVVFAADDGTHGNEVWITYPTTGQTKLLADVNAGPGSSNPNGFVADSNGTLYFQAYTPTTGTELYRILPSGEVQVASDFAAGSNSSTPRDIRLVGTSVYFNAVSTILGGLVRYDTTTLTSTQISDGSVPLIAASPVLSAGNVAIVSAATTTSTGRNLYALSSTGAATLLVSGLTIDRGGWGDKISVTINGVIYFAAYGSADGTELWRSDGTVAGTYRLKDIAPGTADADVRELTAFGNRIYFSASADGGTTTTLWQTDGTAAGTVPVDTAVGFTGVGSIATAPNSVYFIGTGPNNVTGIYKLPLGTGGATATLVSAATPTRKPQTLVTVPNFGPFVVTLDDTQSPRQFSLYKVTTGTPDGVSFVKDLWSYDVLDPTLSGLWGVGHLAFLASGNRLYFPAFRPEWGVEPFSYILDPIPTTIGGTAFWDLNNSGAKDAGEPVAAGATVYVDLDADNTHDSDEPTAIVDSTGVWTFSGLELSNTYRVRLMPMQNAKLTSPIGSNGALIRTVSDTGSSSGGGSFGLADVLAGDVNADGVVGFDDLLALAKHYGTSGNGYADGNVNHDSAGTVDFDDLLLLAKNYNKTLAASAAVTTAAGAGVTPTRKRTTDSILA